jgi:sugar/nucleoside kinase (ribokinase family)
MRSLIAVGEFFFDLIFYRLERLPRMGEEMFTPNFGFTLGGGAPNTGITAARLGRKVEIVTVLGDSPLDDFAVDSLARDGVGTRFIRRHSGSMGAITVSVSLPKDRFLLTYPGANVFLEKHIHQAATRKQLAAAAHVHFALSPHDWTPYATLVRSLKSQGVTTSWDLGWNPKAVRLPGFREVVGTLDIAFFNRAEALHYTKESTPERAIRKLAREQQVIVVKLGARGALALGPDGMQRAPGMKVKCLDTTGAGDAFNGGFLHAWLDGAGLRDCLRVGNVCGALSTVQPGGNKSVPDSATLARALRKMK